MDDLTPEDDMHNELPQKINSPIGYWSSLIATLGGVAYFLVIVGTIISGQFTFPPSDGVQLFGGIISLVICPVIVMVMVALHTFAPVDRKVFSLGGLAFTLLFAISVSVNRFTQLGVVRQSIDYGITEGLDWFLPYADHSVMFGLEMLGWGWFLGIAMLVAAPLFSEGKLKLWLRRLMITYGILGMGSAVAYLFGSPVASVGFVAWGLILFMISGLMTIYFRQHDLQGS